MRLFSGAQYKIVNDQSGTALSVDSQDAVGIMYRGDASQRWELVNAGTDIWYLKSASGNLYPSKDKSKEKLIVVGDVNFPWQIVEEAVSGTFKIYTLGNDDEALEIDGGNPYDGTLARLVSPMDGERSQIWRFEELPPEEPPLSNLEDQGIYRIINDASGALLTLGTSGNPKPVVGAPISANASQQWQISLATPTDVWYLQPVADPSVFLVETAGVNKSVGAVNVKASWNIVPEIGGNFKIYKMFIQEVLQLDGTTVRLVSPVAGDRRQLWRFEKV